MTDQQIIETLATKVMGWHQIPTRPSGPPEVFPAFCFPVYGNTKDGCIVAYKDEEGLIETKNWNPLQNIADAWQVVEKIEQSIEDAFINIERENYETGIYVWSEEIKIAEAFAETTQAAICKVATDQRLIEALTKR